MKKLAVCLLLGLFASTVSAQRPETGSLSLMPKVGVALSKFSDHTIYSSLGSGMDRENKAKFGPGFSVGLEGEYIAHPNIGVSLGLMYAHEGTDHDLKGAEVGLDYLNVPLMANIYVTPQLAFRLGAQVGFLMGDNVGIAYGDHGVTEASSFNSVDFSIPIGVQFEYQRLMLGMRYNWGLTRVFKDSDYFKEKNQVIQIDLGYRLTL